MTSGSELTQVLPHDGFAERAILGAMLINNDYVNEVFSEITSDDFYRDSHKTIAAAINNLIENGGSADIVTVAGHLHKGNELKFVGGPDYISSLLDGVPDTINIEEYIETVKDRSALRRLILASMGVVKSGTEPRAETGQLV